jgi:hypothetical protein
MSKTFELLTTDIGLLQQGLQQPHPAPLLDPFRRLSRIRGNQELDRISSIAWAAEVVCSTAATAKRELNFVEVASLRFAVNCMDRARLSAPIA